MAGTMLATMLPLRGTRLKTFSVMLGCLSIFSMCGVVFGLPALYPSLYGWGYFARSCDRKVLEEWDRSTSLLHGYSDIEKLCETQLSRVSLASSITFFTADAAAGLWGEVVDRFGARRTFVASSVMSLVGFAMLSFLFTGTSVSLSRDMAMTFALALLGFAGPGVFNGAYIGCLSVVNDSPHHLSAFTAYSAACFDGSALVFALLHLVGVKFGLGLTLSMALWGFVCCGFRALFLHCLDEHRMQQLMVMCEAAMHSKGAPSAAAAPSAVASPASGGRPAGPDCISLTVDQPAAPGVSTGLPAGPRAGHTESSGLLGSGGGGANGYTIVQDTPSPSGAGAPGAAVGLGPPKDICAGLLVVLFHRANVAVVALMVSLNLVNAFYLQTQADQLGLLFPSDGAGFLEHFLEFGFPILGFATAVWAATNVFDRWTDRELLCWLWPAGLGIAFCTVQMLTSWTSQLLATILFGPMRTLQWACYFNALAVAPRYPQEVAGRVLGYNNVVIALLSDTIPVWLTTFIVSPYHGADPTPEVQASRYQTIRFVLLLPVLVSTAAIVVIMRRDLNPSGGRLAGQGPTFTS